MLDSSQIVLIGQRDMSFYLKTKKLEAHAPLSQETLYKYYYWSN